MERAEDVLLRKSGVEPIKPYIGRLTPEGRHILIKLIYFQNSLRNLLQEKTHVDLISNAALQLCEPTSSHLVDLKCNLYYGFYYETGNPKTIYIPTMPEIESMVVKSEIKPDDFIMNFLASGRKNTHPKKPASEYCDLRERVLLDQQEELKNPLDLILRDDYSRVSFGSALLIPDISPAFEEIAIAYDERAKFLLEAAGHSSDQTLIRKSLAESLATFYKIRISKLLSQANSANSSPKDTINALYESVNKIGSESLSSHQREEIRLSVKNLLKKCISKLLYFRNQITKSKTDPDSIEEMRQKYEEYKRELIERATFFGEDVSGAITLIESNIG